MADIVQAPAALYTLYRYESLFISLAKPSLLNWDASAFKSQSHQIALGTSESSPNCMESIPVLDASQNSKICISSPSLDIKSFFMLNLLYRPFFVNLLLFVFYKYYYLLQIVVSCFGIFAQSLNSLTPQKISFPVHTQNARSALLSKDLRAFCIHICNLFYQFRLNSASVRSGFFCSAQRMLHSLLKMSRLCPRKSCTHFVSEARLSAVGSVPSLVIQRM